MQNFETLLLPPGPKYPRMEFSQMHYGFRPFYDESYADNEVFQRGVAIFDRPFNKHHYYDGTDLLATIKSCGLNVEELTILNSCDDYLDSDNPSTIIAAYLDSGKNSLRILSSDGTVSTMPIAQYAICEQFRHMKKDESVRMKIRSLESKISAEFSLSLPKSNLGGQIDEIIEFKSASSLSDGKLSLEQSLADYYFSMLMLQSVDGYGNLLYGHLRQISACIDQLRNGEVESFFDAELLSIEVMYFLTR